MHNGYILKTAEKPEALEQQRSLRHRVGNEPKHFIPGLYNATALSIATLFVATYEVEVGRDSRNTGEIAITGMTGYSGHKAELSRAHTHN